MGLDNSDDSGAIMHYSGDDPRITSPDDPKLTQDDKDGIEVLNRGGNASIIIEYPNFERKQSYNLIISFITGEIQDNWSV